LVGDQQQDGFVLEIPSHSLRTTVTQKTAATNAGKDTGVRDLTHHGWGVNQHTHYGGQHGGSSKTKTGTLHSAVAPQLGLHPEESTSGHNRDAHSRVYCSTGHIAKLWSQLRSPENDEWVKRMYIYTMEY
jgi:hypothetical protein